MHESKDARIGGAHLHWQPRPTPRAPLVSLFEQAQVPIKVPPPYSIGDALKHALAEVAGGADRMIQRHDKSAELNGYEVVRIRRGTDRNNYDQVLMAAKITFDHGYDGELDGENIEITFPEWSERYKDDETQRKWGEVEDALRTHYRWARQTVASTAMTGMILEAIEKLAGTCIMEGGGLYWIPPWHTKIDNGGQPQLDANGQIMMVNCVQTMTAFAQLVESVSETRISVVEILMSPSAAKDAINGLVKEMADAYKKLDDEVASKEMGERAVKNRLRNADALTAKVKEYEAVLGQAIPAAHAKIMEYRERVREATTIAVADEQCSEGGAFADLLAV